LIGKNYRIGRFSRCIWSKFEPRRSDFIVNLINTKVK